MNTVFGKLTEEQFRDKALAGLIAGAAMDAFGNYCQFSGRVPKERWARDMVPARWSGTPAGAYTDDTSMSLAVAQAFTDCGRYEAKHTMDLLLEWFQDGRFSAIRGRAFDVGLATSSALSRYARTGSLKNGNEQSRGNGSVLRNLSAFLIGLAEGDVTRITHEISDMTHASAFVRGYIDILNDIFRRHLLEGAPAEYQRDRIVGAWTYDTFPSGGFVQDTVEGALWCHYTSSSFEEGALKACNSGNDSDSTAAIYGAIAGTRYGMAAIPQRWLNQLQDGKELLATFSAFVDAVIAKMTARHSENDKSR